MSGVAYACTTTDCSERFRGFCDTGGRTIDGLNALAESAPRPLPEVTGR